MVFSITFLKAQVVSDTSKFRSDTSNTEIFSLSSDDLESEAQNQDVSSLLQSSRDVFFAAAGYNFSNARYRVRGYQSNQYTVMINGVTMDNPEMGWGIWSFWGGLNDVTRYPENQNGISSCHYNFSSIGGFSNIDMRASRYRKGTRVSYALTNRTYRNRVMLTHSTGLMKNGWAVTISGSGRWSKEGYVEGTYYSGASYFLAVEKKINEKHSINFSGFGVPTIQGRAGIAVQEAYDLKENHYYNPYWGYQTSEKTGERVKRNARVRNNHQPSLFLTHIWEMNSKKNLQTSVYSSFGRTGNTNLNWNDAVDPRPDYYKYLPSYYQQTDPNMTSYLTDHWQNDSDFGQINWDDMYNANYKNLYTLENADGIEGNDVTFNRSKYIVEEYRVDPLQLGINSVYNADINNAMHVSTGLNIDQYVSHNYKVVDDLLGGDYWLDVNQFAEQLGSDPMIQQNNIDEPNQLIGLNEKFGYNYNIHINSATTFGQIEQIREVIDWYAGATISYTSFYREGLWTNGQFPNDSKGKSEVFTFFNYGAKAGAVYKLTGRHFITANALYQTNAPYSKEVFIAPNTRNTAVTGVTDTKTMSGDLNYHVRYANLKARASIYYTAVNDQISSTSFYHDQYRNLVNYVMTDVDQVFTGAEFGIEAKIADVFVLTGAFGTGDFYYNSRPKATVTVDNSAELLADNKTIYLENYHIGGMPETAASIGLKYNSPKFWFVGLSFNYFTEIYLTPNPDRRTEEAIAKYVDTDPQVRDILDQTVIHDLEHNDFFDNNYTLDAFVGKSFKIKDQYLRINASVNNILNNKSFLTGGFEQLRFDSNDINKFPPKYGYMYGTTYFVMISYSL